MSKRRDEYNKALDRLTKFLEMFFKLESTPSEDDILDEYKAITQLRNIPLILELSHQPLDRDDGFFFMVGEEFERFDDVLPVAMHITLLPNSIDEPKELNRYFTSLPIN